MVIMYMHNEIISCVWKLFWMWLGRQALTSYIHLRACAHDREKEQKRRCGQKNRRWCIEAAYALSIVNFGGGAQIHLIKEINISCLKFKCHSHAH